MKKIIYSVLATLSGLVLLFSYKTSWNESVVDTSAATISSDTTSADSTTSDTDSSASDSSSDDDEDEYEDDEDGEDDEDDSSASSGSTSSGSSSSSSSSSSSTSSSSLADGTYTGDAANTRYGAVQVAITVSGGEITSVDVPQYPSHDHHDVQINSYALPILVDETISAQSSSISMVSGATYTSQGYIQSLQSAIDQAQQ